MLQAIPIYLLAVSFIFPALCLLAFVYSVGVCILACPLLIIAVSGLLLDCLNFGHATALFPFCACVWINYMYSYRHVNSADVYASLL